MQVECPSCGCRFKFNKAGRRVKITESVNNIIDTLRQEMSVKGAAKKLNCSRGIIYKRLQSIGIDPRTITGRKFTKRSKEIEN